MTKKRGLIYKIFISILILIGASVLLLAWVISTEIGVIPNFLGIDALEYEYRGGENDTPGPRGSINFGKPIIYLYPKQETKVDVELIFDGKLIATYPTYDENIHGWKVIARPDGTLIDQKDGREYSYLFWEGDSYAPVHFNSTKGFVVKGSDTKKFLQEKLSEIGLNPKEYNEFIVYWYPKMMNNTYNWVYFAGKEYTDTAKLTITPKPDSVLRIFMVFKGLDHPLDVQTQTFEKFTRTDFSVVEWGGTELK